MSDTNNIDIEKFLALAQQVQAAAPFVSDMIYSYLDGMKGKIDMAKLTTKLKEVVGPELSPLRDLFREIEENAAMARGKLVQKLVTDCKLSESTALAIVLDGSLETAIRNLMTKKR
jgi:hypothetical protein